MKIYHLEQWRNTCIQLIHNRSGSEYRKLHKPLMMPEVGLTIEREKEEPGLTLV
jgi:hypothetical protein